jgi:hypothetical protein
MAFHKATGTLLIACTGTDTAEADACIELLDTRPPLVDRPHSHSVLSQ